MNKQTIRDILNVRQTTHGDYSEWSALWISLVETFMAAENWDDLPAHMKATLLMQANKQARILAGDPNEPDHWLDIEGYTTLTKDRLPKVPALVNPTPFADATMETDLHQIVADLTGLSRRSAKDANFAKAYGATREHTERIVPRHSSVSVEYPPWIIQAVIPLLDPYQRWYKLAGNDLYMLEPWVNWSGEDGDRPPPDLDDYYTFANFIKTRGWLLEIHKCPAEIRDRWEFYSEERTEAEFQHLFTREQGLYELKGERYQLKSPYKAWARG